MNTMTLKVDFRLICALLSLAILIMLAIWQPWYGPSGSRTMSVTGEAIVKAAPDRFTFAPTYQAEAETSAEAISAVSSVGNGIATKLKELGVAERSIKNNVTAGQGFEPFRGEPNGKFTAQYTLTAVVESEALAQQVLDYLVTTSPLYGVSPQSGFQEETERRLEAEARVGAIADAKAKAEQSAQELEVDLGRVISVSEPTWGGSIPIGSPELKTRDTSQSSSPTLLTGEQEVSYTTTVVFALR